MRLKGNKNRDVCENNIPAAARYHIPLTMINRGQPAPLISELSLFRNLNLYSKSKKLLAISSTFARLNCNKYKIQMWNVFQLQQKISTITTKSTTTLKDKITIKLSQLEIIKFHSSKDSPKSICEISKNKNLKLLLPSFSLFCSLSVCWF